MSEFMKSIVQEVLNNQGKSTISIQTQTVSSPSVSKVQPNTQSNGKDSLTSLNRPNYQRMKKEQRLSVSGLTTPSGPNQHAVKPTQHENSSNKLKKDLLSQFSTVALGQGKVERNYGSHPIPKSIKPKQPPKLLGKTKDESYVWYFPTVTDQLAPKFKRTTNGAAVGVITSKVCLPSQLLLVNDVMRENTDSKYHLSWDRNNKDSFVWELYDHDSTRLERKLQAILQILHRKSSKIIDSYTVVSPSAWLSTQLNISTSVEAISILEGVPYYASLLLLEQYFSSGEQKPFQYSIENNYLIISGPHQVISKVIQDFRKKAESLL